MSSIAAVAAALLAGCTFGAQAASPARAPGPTAPPVPTAVRELWRVPAITPISAVVNAAGTAVVYGVDGGTIYLYGLDPATGKQRWRHAASAPQPEGIAVATVGGSVAYFNPVDPDGRSTLVLADAATGADRVVTAPRYWSRWPAPCADDTRKLCAGAELPGSTGWTPLEYRLDAATGNLTPVAAPAGGVAYGSDNLIVYPDSAPYRIGVAHGAASRWSASVTDLLGLPKDGWPQWDYTLSPDKSVLLLDGRSRYTRGVFAAPLDLTKDLMTSGIAQATGRRLWLEHGTDTGCFGADLPPAAIDGHLLRCRYVGTSLDGAFTSIDRLKPGKVRVRLESFDPKAGKTDWSADLGVIPALTGIAEGTIGFGDRKLLFNPGPHPVMVDLRTGRTTTQPAGAVWWCKTTRAFPRSGQPATRGVATDGISSGTASPCSADGKHPSGKIHTIPGTVSTPFDSYRVLVAQPDGVVGYEAPPDTAAPERNPKPTSGTVTTSAKITGAPVAPAVVHAKAVLPTKAWSTSFRPLTAPEIEKNTALVYGQSGDTRIKLYGLDPATGKVRWEFAASNGAMSPDDELTLATFDHDAIAIAETNRTRHDGDSSPLVRVDAANGKVKWKTKPLGWASRPSSCANDTAICAWAWGWDTSTDKSVRVKINPATGAISANKDDETDPMTLDNVTARTKGEHRNLDGYRDGKVVWTKALDGLVGKDPTVTSWFWSFLPSNALLISADVNRAKRPDGTYPEVNLQKNRIVTAVDRATGKTLWRLAGLSLYCDGLADFSLGSTPAVSPTLACRYRGTLYSVPSGAQDPRISKGLSVALQDIDPATGKPLWSVDLGADEGLVLRDSPVPIIQVDDTSILAGDRKHRVVVDLATGKTRSPGADEVFWCTKTTSFTQNVIWYGNNHEDAQRTGGTVAFPCDRDGTATSAPPTTLPRAPATSYGGTIRLVPTPDSLVAYRVS